MNKAIYTELFMKSCKREEKERREDGDSGLGGNLSLGPPEKQPSLNNNASAVTIGHSLSPSDI